MILCKQVVQWSPGYELHLSQPSEQITDISPSEGTTLLLLVCLSVNKDKHKESPCLPHPPILLYVLTKGIP